MLELKIWNPVPTIWNLDFLKSGFQMVGFQMVWFSKGLAIAMIPTIWNQDHSKSGHFCQDFKWFLIKWFLIKWFFDKMATNCLDFEWLGFWISVSIQNLQYLQTNLFLTIWNPDLCRFQIPTVNRKLCLVQRASSSRDNRMPMKFG